MDANEPTVKKSHAVKIWLLVIAAVLVVLYIETSGPGKPAYNVVVNAAKDQTGYDVLVDGKVETQLQNGKETGIDGSVCWLVVSPGKHKIELASQGKSVSSKEIDVVGKEYLRFE